MFGCQTRPRRGISTHRSYRGTAGYAREALDLAQERYRLGLGSIVELSQTLLSLTDAEVANASAKFEFLIERSVLEYESWRVHGRRVR